jgi:hypothetical protein
MVDRVVKATVSGWRPWAIGAVLSIGCAAFAIFRMQRSAKLALDAYEEWWRHRDKVRSNGDQPPADGYRTGSSQMFV